MPDKINTEGLLENVTDIFSRLEEIKETQPYAYKTFILAFINGVDAAVKPKADENLSKALKAVQDVIAEKVISMSGKELQELFYKEIASQQKQISKEALYATE